MYMHMSLSHLSVYHSSAVMLIDMGPLVSDIHVEALL